MFAQYKRGGGILFLMTAFLLTVSGANLAETPMTIQNFVVLGQEGVWIKQGSTIVSGDIGANTASAGPFLSDGAEVVVGLDVKTLDPTARVMGDSLRIRQGAQVYNVSYNDLSGPGQILGSRVSPASLPLVRTLPPVPGFAPGTQNFTVPLNGTLRLNAGSYGTLLARGGATVTLTGGIYNFQTWDLRNAVKLYVEAPTEIRIAGRLNTDINSYVGPSPTAAGINAADISIIVTGVNGTTGTLDSIPKTAEFGLQNTIAATVYAPNGTLWIKQGGTATGAFLGRWVIIGEEVRMIYAGTADHDPPTVTTSVTPPPNATGWHHQDVTVTFTCSDAGSGIAQCPGPVVVSQEGAGQVISGTATDRAGNSAGVSVGLNIDKTPPNVFITSPQDGSIRKTSPVTIAGTSADALSGVSIIMCGSTPAALSGANFACQPPLTEGANLIPVQTADAAGNVAAVDITLTLDTIAPLVSIISPADGSQIDTDMVAVSGLVDDAAASVIVNGVTAMVTADGHWTAESVPTQDGENILSAVATDAAGNNGQSQVVIRRVTALTPLTLCAKPYQEELPQLPLGECAAQALASYVGYGSTVGLVAGLVDERVVSLTVNGILLPDGEEISDEEPIRDGMREGGFFWAFVTIPQIPGNYSITAVATDAQGTKQSATVNFSPALIFCAELFLEQTPQPPTEACTSHSFAKHTGFVAGLLDTSEVSVSINDVELPDGVQVIDDWPIVEGMREGNFFWAFVGIERVDGLHSFTAVATNAEGEERRATVTFLRDSVPARVIIVAPPEGAFLNTPIAAIMGTVDDPEAIVRVGFFGPAIPLNNSDFQVTVPLPVEGTNSISLTADDQSGNLTITTRRIIRDTVPPTVIISSPQVGGIVNTPTIAVQGTVTDWNPVTTTMTMNAGQPQTLGLSAGAYNSTATLVEGTNQILVQATDAAGNVGTASSSFLLDAIPPSVHVTAPAPGAQLSGTVFVTADVSDLLSGIQQVDLLANGVNMASRSAAPYNFSLNTALLSAGDTTLTVHAIDRAGNVTDGVIAVSILGGQIALQITSPAAGETITQSPILVRGTLKKNSMEPITEEVGIMVNGVLAQFQGTEFGVEGISLEPGLQTLIATATGSSGPLATTSIEVTLAPGEPDTPPLVLRVAPSCAVLPSPSVTFTTDEALPLPLVLYQLDADGNGTPDIERPTFSEVSYTYTAPGLYFPTLTATDSEGSMLTVTAMVNVLDRSVIDGVLRAKWTSMVSALSNGDTETALGQIATEARPQYETMFGLLRDQLPSIMSTASEFNFVSLTCNSARYELVTTESNGAYSYEVTFSKDTNGLWKITGF